MLQIEDTELFTVNILGHPLENKSDDQDQDKLEDNKTDNQLGDLSVLGEYTNMKSAKIIDGRVVELGHSLLAGPEVKFKTVINYERLIEPRSSLGIILKPQDGYLAKIDTA